MAILIDLPCIIQYVFEKKQINLVSVVKKIRKWLRIDLNELEDEVPNISNIIDRIMNRLRMLMQIHHMFATIIRGTRPK